MIDPQVLEALNKLTDEVTYLRKHLFFQIAALEGLRDYVVAHASDGQSAQKQISQLSRQRYDRWIAMIEKDNPGYAASIDMRPDLAEQDQDRWYFPTSDE